jgi:hypothetical protein
MIAGATVLVAAPETAAAPMIAYIPSSILILIGLISYI